MRKEPNANPLFLLLLIGLLICVMAVLSLFIKKENTSAINTVSGKVISHATLVDNVNKKIIYIQGKDKISPNYIKTVDILCDVKDYQSYPVGKQLNNYDCKFDKKEFNKQIIASQS